MIKNIPLKSVKKGLIIAALILASIAITGTIFIYKQLNSSINWTSNKTFIVKSGAGVEKIIKRLSEDKVITVPEEILRIYALVTRFRGTLKAGEYDLSETRTPIEVLALFRSGKVLVRRITFIEGWTFAEWRNHLKKSPFITHILGDTEDEKLMLGIAGKPDLAPEGWFFPDTYQFTRGDSDIQILRRAHRKMTNILEEEWSIRTVGNSITNIYDALILASIIESETGVDEDRGKISQVFVRRLNRNIRLQSDPTVIYGLGRTFDGNLTKNDLRKKTPFNTYTNFGLPRTPIGMPSLASIRAALNPEKTEYLYFVGKGDGASYFSKTLAEHNRAVELYQRSGRLKNYQSAP